MTKPANPTAKTFARPPADPVSTRVPFSFVHINKCGGSSVEIALGVQKAHRTATSMRDELGHDAWAERFTFAVVRNPFERAVSIYYYRVRTDQGRMGDRHINVNAWIQKVWVDEDPAYRDGSPILFAPAFDWVSEAGHLIVSKIARLESLSDDWVDIAKTLGVAPALHLTNWNMHPPYRELLSAEARAILEGAFQSDLEHFGYEF